MDASSIISGKSTLVNSIRTVGSSVKYWIKKRNEFEKEFTADIKRPDIIRLGIRNISAVDQELFPIVIVHHFIDDMPGPTILYGITRMFERDQIRQLLAKEYLYYCCENVVYTWNEKKQEYLETMKFRNTDNGRY